MAAELSKEEWDAFIEYDQSPITQEEIDFGEDCSLAYNRHEDRKVDAAVRRFWSV